MMPAESDLKERVLNRLNFLAFYRQELGELKPGRGANHLAICPFHADTNPSLNVNTESGLFKCFACDAAGDVFEFYQRKHGLGFREALEELAGQLGVEKKSGITEPFQSLSLEALARDKRLPVEFLRQHGLHEHQFPPHIFDGAKAVNFPYYNKRREVKAIRRRFANRGEKKFRWRSGDKALPYGLWRLGEMQGLGWCLLVEGETDVLTGWLYDLPVLGIPGAGCFKATFANYLQGFQVYVWQEPDEAGGKFTASIGQALPEALVIRAPAGTKDISEAHCRGDDLKALMPVWLAEAQPIPKPPPPPPSEPAAERLSLSDLGNARRLIAQHGRDLRYCHLNKKWYVWQGTHWSVDNLAEVERRAKLTVAGIYREASEALGEEVRRAIAGFALKSEASQRLLGMLRLAQSEPGVPILPRDLDRDPWLFNCTNGTVELATGELREHRRADLITRLVPYDYDPEADCDLWERFLFRIQDNNLDVIDFLQRALGYALTGSTQEQCLFIFWGTGANGKSTLLNLVHDLLGNYALHTPVETLLIRNKGGEIPTDVARLDGPRLVTASEVDRGRRLAESLVKELTGRDVVSARFLYGDYFDFVPQFKLFLSTNNKPVIKGNDHAIWRRIKLVPFPVQLPEAEWDRELPEKLKAEAFGILAWLVRGCRNWLSQGLDAPVDVTEATRAYRAEMDVLQDFLEDRCLINPQIDVSAHDIYKAYQDWAEAEGMSEREIMKQRTFGICLGERGFVKVKSTAGIRLWRGLGLLSSMK